MRLSSWLWAAAVISGLAVGCEEGSGDDGDGPTSDGGGTAQDASQDASASGGDAAADAGAGQDDDGGGVDASMDAAASQDSGAKPDAAAAMSDASTAGSGGMAGSSGGTGGTGGSAGGSAGTGGGTVTPARCPVRNLRNEILDAFHNINTRICDVCFDDPRSNCPAAVFGAGAVECYIDHACNSDEDAQNEARCLTGALAGEHGECNQFGEEACTNDCYSQTLHKAVLDCDYPNLGDALSRCGFSLGN